MPAAPTRDPPTDCDQLPGASKNATGLLQIGGTEISPYLVRTGAPETHRGAVRSSERSAAASLGKVVISDAERKARTVSGRASQGNGLPDMVGHGGNG